MAWFIGIVLIVAIVLCYLRGVKKQKPWGKKAIVGLSLCLLVVALLKAYSSRTGGGEVTRGESLSDVEYERAKMLGQGLKGQIEPGSRIFILSVYPPAGGPGVQQARESWRKGLSDGLGDTTWQVAGYFGPAPGDAAALSEGMAEQFDDIDVVVSFAGLPHDLENMSMYQREQEPKVAAYFHNPDDLDLIRKWLKDELIHAVVIGRDGKLKVYTRDDLP